MKLFELWATLGLDTRDFEQGTKSARGTVQSFGNKIQSSVKASTVAVGNLMSSAVQKVASGFVDMTKQAFGAVSTLEQNIGGSEQVFGDYAAEIQNWGKEAFQYVGLSQGEYIGYANKMAAIMQGLGFSQEQSLDLTTDAIQRGADVTSIMGLDVQEAMTALIALSKGQFNLMDNLGVAMTEDTLQAYALEAGIEKAVSKMSQPEKILLGFDMFLNKTTYAMGNYAKELDTLAGSTQTMKASFQNLLAGSGTVDDFVRTVENAARVAFKNLKEIVPRLGQSIVSAGKLFAPKIDSLLGDLWDNELPGFVTRGVNGLIDGVNDLLGTNIPHIDTIELPTWDQMKEKVAMWWSTTKTKLQEATTLVLNVFGFEDANAAIASIKTSWGNVVSTVTNLDSIVDEFLGFDLDESFTGAMQQIIDWWDETGAAGAIQKAIDKAKEFLGLDGTKTFDVQFNYHVNTFQNAVGNVGESVSGATGSGFLGQQAESVVKNSVYNPDTAPGVYDALQWLFKPKASGLPYVPYDNYAASLHAGEAVLTRQQAENWRSGGSGGASADEIAAAVSSALEGKAVVLGDQIVGVLTDRIDRSLSKKTKMTRRYAAT